jgi:UDP-N-acetylglucosamine 3-dehydrogenase
VAVLGLGAMGRQHVRVLMELPGVELTAVCDSSEAARSSVSEAFQLPAVESWQELLESDVDAVVNALPTPEHYATSRAFLEAGKSVLVEKPIAVTREEAEELIAAAQRAKRTLMVGHVERYNPAVRALRRVIAEGQLGDVVSMSARRVGVARPVAPRTDVVIDLAIHDIDVFGYLLPEQQGRLVFAAGATLGGNQLEDHADLLLRFGPTVAVVHANWITPVKIRRLTVTGTTGFAEVDYLTQSLRVYRAAPEVFAGPVWNFFAVARESEPEEVPVTRSEPLRAELEHFVEAVQAGDLLLAETRQAARALSLAIEATDVMRGRSR